MLAYHLSNAARNKSNAILVTGFLFMCISAPFLIFDSRGLQTFDTKLGDVQVGPELVTSFIEDTIQLISVNANSTLSPDIEKISHHSLEQKIVVHLKDKRRCINPILRGRLSGPALAIINWKKDLNDEQQQNEVIGYYQVPLTAGARYFIEIIGLYCNSIAFDENFKKKCLEYPTKNIITSKGSFIDVVVTAEKNNYMKKQPLGYYMSRLADPVPLVTRYQIKECLNIEKMKPTQTPFCQKITSRSRFEPYYWTWTNEAHSLEKTPDHLKNDHQEVCLVGMTHVRYMCKNLDHLKNNPQKVCFIGTSHSRRMHAYVKDFLKPEDHVYVHYQEIRYPTKVTKEWVEKYIVQEKCTKVVVGMGQWPASIIPNPLTRDHPTLFPAYEQQMMDATRLLKEVGVRVYLRSVNYNPINYIISSCPPKDWRNPVVIDEYNAILDRISAKLNVTFLDTTSIIGPMWDQAADWYHYDDEGGEMQALYILQQVL